MKAKEKVPQKPKTITYGFTPYGYSKNIPTRREPGEYRYVVDLDSVDKAYEKFIKMYSNLERTYTLPKGIPGKKSGKGISLRVQGVKEFAKNLYNLVPEVAKRVRLQYIEAAQDILLQAVRWAPVETGQLRQSGRALVGSRLIAAGTNVGTTGNIEKFPPSHTGWRSDPLTIHISFSDEGRVKKVKTGKQGRPRTVSSDFLVSVWTHENLQYQGTVPGTGPKYLERAFKQAVPLVLKQVEKQVRLEMKKANSK